MQQGSSPQLGLQFSLPLERFWLLDILVDVTLLALLGFTRLLLPLLLTVAETALKGCAEPVVCPCNIAFPDCITKQHCQKDMRVWDTTVCILQQEQAGKIGATCSTG